MVGWHHQLNEDEFEQALGVGDGQGSLACCSPGAAKSQTRQPLNLAKKQKNYEKRTVRQKNYISETMKKMCLASSVSSLFQPLWNVKMGTRMPIRWVKSL